MISLVGTKIVVMVLTGLVPIILGLLPWKIGRNINQENRRHQITISCLLCFGAGILLALSLLHMLPEIRESLEDQFPNEENLAEILVCLGFFFIYLIEEVVHSACTQNSNSPDESHILESNTHHNHAESTIRDFLTTLALSLHAVFEGMAVGLEKTTTDVWTLYAGIAMHKYVLSFCLGLELFTGSGRANRFWVNLGYILLYALMSPIGIGVGIAVTQEANETLSGVLSALAAGTLIYVSMFEIIQREKCKENVPGLAQLICILIGFAAILLFTRYGPDV